jgi:hypothetical protein
MDGRRFIYIARICAPSLKAKFRVPKLTATNRLQQTSMCRLWLRQSGTMDRFFPAIAESCVESAAGLGILPSDTGYKGGTGYETCGPRRAMFWFPDPKHAADAPLSVQPLFRRR